MVDQCGGLGCCAAAVSFRFMYSNFLSIQETFRTNLTTIEELISVISRMESIVILALTWSFPENDCNCICPRLMALLLLSNDI